MGPVDGYGHSMLARRRPTGKVINKAYTTEDAATARSLYRASLRRFVLLFLGPHCVVLLENAKTTN
jgi:hypothetical protein